MWTRPKHVRQLSRRRPERRRWTGSGPHCSLTSEPDEHLFEAIAFGRNDMPAFVDLLTEEEIQAIVDYIRQVQAEGMG